MYAYVVLSLLIGARTEELRALTWSHVDLEGKPDANPPVPASIMVWRSVRASGDTKTQEVPANVGPADAMRGSAAVPPRAAAGTTRSGWGRDGRITASFSLPMSAPSARRATCGVRSGPVGPCCCSLVTVRMGYHLGPWS